jgi:hypothetical protein
VKCSPALFVVLFVELTDQFLEHITHTQIGERRQTIAVVIFPFLGRQIDIRRGEFLQHIEQHILARHVVHLILEIELVDDLFDVGAEAVQIFFHIRQQNLAVIGSGFTQPGLRPWQAELISNPSRNNRTQSLTKKATL